MSVRLLHVSDVETAYDDPDRVGRLASAIRRRNGPDALVAGSGDTTGPSVLSLVAAGGQATPFFERVGVDVDVPGNHDLDHGLSAAAQQFAASPQTWLATNVATEGTPLEGLAERTMLSVADCVPSQAPHDGHNAADTADGQPADSAGGPGATNGGSAAVATVGVTGVTTPDLPDITPPASDLEIDDPTTAARDAVEGLRADGADYVVLLAHVREPERFARELDVDAVLAGHVHEEHAAVVDGVPVTRPAVRGESLFEITLGEAPEIERVAVPDATVDEVTADAIREQLADADLLETVAAVTEPIERTPRALRGGESRLGNVVADAYRWRGDADVGLQNAAGLREGPALAGEVTVGELVGLVPFDADLVVTTVSGAQLRAACREASPQVCDTLPDDAWNAHWSGIEGVWDREAGTFTSLTVGGEPIDPDATYELATSEYIVDTPHEFPALCGATIERRFGTQYDALVEYARSEGVDPERDGRLTFA